jgi:ADP-ribosylglycohydrolase
VQIDWQRPWRLSDDTQLTLATCEAIIESTAVDPAIIARQMATWFRQRRVTGMGASTYKALQELVEGGHWALVGRKGEFAAGNGAAARIAPLAFLLQPESTVDRQLIRDVSHITHHSDEAYAGALAVVGAIRMAARGELSDIHFVRRAADILPDTCVRDRLIELSELGSTPLQEVAARWGCSAYVVESVPLALYAAQLIQSIGFQATLEQIISVGGDTDTMAAIAGQVMGVFCGHDSLPESLKERLPDREAVELVSSLFGSVVNLAR